MDASIRPCAKFPNCFLVSTTDFFYPLVEDPFLQGRIACANVLSDMYAMGVEHIDSVLMILGVSIDMAPKEQDVVTRELIKGFNACCKEAGTEVSGGQTVKNPWPIVGGVAQSMCAMEHIIMPENAVAGDVLVLTKALGTQVAVNVSEWIQQRKACDERHWAKAKALVSEEEVKEMYDTACASMSRLNRVGARLMHEFKAHAATDVTGFGLQGHGANLASNQKAPVSFRIHSLPVIRNTDKISTEMKMFNLLGGYSAETSGGLLIAMPKQEAAGFCAAILEEDGQPAWVIGDVVEGDRSCTIVDNPTIIPV